MTGSPPLDESAFQPLRMGLEPRDLAHWLKPEGGDHLLLAERAQLIAARRDDVIAALPGSESAVAELAQILGQRGIPDLAHTDPVSIMIAIGRTVAEDICVLTPSPNGYRLTAAALCFPNRWRLSDKLGGDLLALHDPVPGYAQTLADAVNRFLTRLRPMRLYMRDNWGLASCADRHLPEPVAPVNLRHPAGIFARSEAQGFVKLPETGAVIFSIRTTIVSWDRVPENRRAAIYNAVTKLSPEWLAYKSIVRDES